jgi:hypothetical protein
VSGEHEPIIARPLPRANEAVIDPAKLVRYALDPTSADGRHKAVVFKLAPGIEKDDWEYLRDRILEARPRHPVATVRHPERPEKPSTWTVPVPVLGLNGRVLVVLTVWKLTAGRPELVTTRVVHTEHLVDEEGLPLRDLMDDLVDVPYDDLEVVYSPAPLSLADLEAEGSGSDGQSPRAKK